MTPRSLRGLGLVTLLCTALVVAQPASADDAAITTSALPQGLSHISPLRTVLAASDSMVLSQRYDGTWTLTTIADRTDNAWQTVAGHPQTQPSLSEDTVTSSDDYYHSVVAYRRLDGSSGSGWSNGRHYLSAAPGGWLNDDGSFVHAAPGNAVEQLAVLDRDDSSRAVDLARADTKHAVFSWLDGPILAPTSRRFTVVDWESRKVTQYVEPVSWCTTEISIPRGMTCASEYLDLTGNGVVWFDPLSRRVHRLSFSTGQTVTTQLGPVTLGHLRATDAATGWTYRDASGHSFFTTLTGTDSETSPIGNTGLAATDSRFWLDPGSRTTAPGLYSTTSASAAPVLLVPDPVIPATANYWSPVPTTGRVAWYDDQLADHTFLDRQYTGGAGLGQQRVISASTYGGPPMVSGRRSLFFGRPGMGRELLETLGSGLPPAPFTDWALGVSGTRVLVNDSTDRLPYRWRVVDVVTGTTRSFVAHFISLWGDHVVYATPAGDVFWQELSLPDALPVFLTHLELGAYTELWTAGDYVGWTGCTWDQGRCVLADAVRSMRLTDPPVTLPTWGRLVALSDSYAVAATSTELAVIDLASGATTTLSTGNRIAAADANRVGWISAVFGDAGEPRLSVLPDTGVPGRALGTTGVPTAVARPVQTSWSGEVDASRPLASCSVSIRSLLAPVATVPCQDDVLQHGAAVFTWDLKDDHGLPVLDGDYTWTLHALDSHGPVRDAHGDDAPIAGTVHVGPGLVTATTTSATRTDGAWVTAFSEDVRGVTTSNLRLHDTAGSTVPVTTTCRTSSGALTPCSGWARYAVQRPVTPLLAGASYRVDTNPVGATSPVLAVSGAAAQRTSSPPRKVTASASTFLQSWAVLARPGAVGGSVLAERRAGAQLTGAFTGTGLRFTYTSGPGHGLVDVRVDGRSVALVDEYAARVTDRQSRLVTGLGLGTHRFELVVTGRHRSGATGSLATVDTVTTASGTAIGVLQRWSGPAPAIGTAMTGARATTAFAGGRLVLTRQSGAAATVLVDGVKVGMFTGTTYGRSGFSSGRHTVSVVSGGPLTLLSLST